MTRAAARRHLQRPGLVGVLGPQCSAGAELTIPIYNAAGVVSISGPATLSRLAENQREPHFFFRTAYRNDTQAALVGVYVTAEAFLGADDAFVVDDNEAYGIGLASDIIAQLQLAGVSVTRASVEQGAVNFSELARTIADAAPDVLIYAGFNPAAGLLLRQARDAGYEGPFAGGDALCGGPACAFLVALGDQAEGAAFSGCSPPLPTDSVQQFTGVHAESVEDGPGTPTASFVAHYADATTILLDALAAVAEVRGIRSSSTRGDCEMRSPQAASREGCRATFRSTQTATAPARFRRSTPTRTPIPTHRTRWGSFRRALGWCPAS